MRSSERSHSWVGFLGPLGWELVGVLLQEHVPSSEAATAPAGWRWHLMWPELKLQLGIAYNTGEHTSVATTAPAAG